jgi:hypothetical protein
MIAGAVGDLRHMVSTTLPPSYPYFLYKVKVLTIRDRACYKVDNDLAH